MPVDSFRCALLVSSFLIRNELLRDKPGDRVSKFCMLTGSERDGESGNFEEFKAEKMTHL